MVLSTSNPIGGVGTNCTSCHTSERRIHLLRAGSVAVYLKCFFIRCADVKVGSNTGLNAFIGWRRCRITNSQYMKEFLTSESLPHWSRMKKKTRIEFRLGFFLSRKSTMSKTPRYVRYRIHSILNLLSHFLLSLYVVDKALLHHSHYYVYII